MTIKELLDTSKVKLANSIDDAASSYYNKVVSTRVCRKITEIEERNSKKEPKITKQKVLSKKAEIKKSTEDRLTEYAEELFNKFDNKTSTVKKHVKIKKK